jgi:hypothetical protein
MGFFQAPVAERQRALPPEGQERIMPVTEFWEGYRFDPETRRVMGIAYEMAWTAFPLKIRTERLKESVAKKIIALAKEGLRDPNLLCEWALDDLRNSYA